MNCRGQALALMFCAALVGGPPTVRAQWVVFDPSNYAQNVLSAVRALQQINNQVQSLHNEATMLVNDAKNLARLPSSVIGQLQATLATTDQLLQGARGITLDVQRTQNEFMRLYPDSYGTAITSGGMLADVHGRWMAALEALRTAAMVQAQATVNLREDERVLERLVNSSQDAIGSLQATQATNQLLALQARQLMQDQHLRITQERAIATEQGRAIAEAARSTEIRRRFVGSGTRYSRYEVGGF